MMLSRRISQLAAKLAVGLTSAAIIAVMSVPVTSQLGGAELFGATEARAQDHSGGQGGHSGGDGGHSGGQGGHSGGQGGHSGGQGGHSGGSGGGGISGANLGRLNMARALLSPGFDETKIDDDEAPLMQIVKYRDLMKAGDEDTWQAAAQALANAATVPISVTTVQKLNSLLGTQYNYDVPIAEFAAYAQSLNKNEEH